MSSTPNLDRRRNEIRNRQLTLRNMLSNPGAYFKSYYRRKKKASKKKAMKRLNQTKTSMDKVWLGQRGGKINTTKRMVKNNIPTIYQYYQ